MFINISRSKKYMCRVSKSCVFKLLQNLENSLQNYPENPGNCVSGIPDFKILPPDPQLQCPGAATAAPFFEWLHSCFFKTLKKFAVQNFTSEIIFTVAQLQYSEWTVGPQSSATCPPMFMQFTGCQQPVQRFY